MYKTTNKDHKPSVGILHDLIMKYGANSNEVASYVTRFATDKRFQKKAHMLVSAASNIDDVKQNFGGVNSKSEDNDKAE